MDEVTHDPNDYEPGSFASIMRRIFANVMHHYPEKPGEDGKILFARVHGRVHPLREKLLRAYNSQFTGGRKPDDAVDLVRFGIFAVNAINEGKQPEWIVKLSNTKLVKLARDAQPVQAEAQR